MLQEFQLAFGCTEVYMKDWRQYISFICVSQHPAAKPISQNHYFCILTSAFSMPIQVLFDTLNWLDLYGTLTVYLPNLGNVKQGFISNHLVIGE